MIRYDVPEGRQMILIHFSNRLPLNLMSRFVNLSCELVTIVTRYDFLVSNLKLLVNFSCEFGANNDQF